MIKKKNIVLFSFILIVLVIIFCIFFYKNKKSNAESKSEYSLVLKEVVENVIEISGTVEAAQSQSLQAAGDGLVMAVYAKAGDSVKKGQVLVELDTTSQEYDIAKLDYDIAQTKINGNKKELELKLVQRKSLEQKLEDRKIIANFSGILADFHVAPGDYLEAKDSVGTLIERSYLKSYVEVVETDAPKLAANQIVHCTFPSYGDKIIDGYVVSYPQVGTLTSRGASIVNVEIRIDNPPEIILPNYSFTGQIQITPPEILLLIENRAIAFQNKVAFVEKLDKDGSFEKVEISVEPYGSGYYKLLSGNLNPGDKLKYLQPLPISGTKPVNKKNDKNSSQNRNPGFGNFGDGMPPRR